MSMTSKLNALFIKYNERVVQYIWNESNQLRMESEFNSPEVMSWETQKIRIAVVIGG